MTRVTRSAGLVAIGLGLAFAVGCSPAPPPPPPPPPPPAPAPVPRPAPEAPAEWRDRPLSPGAWVYRTDERGSIALYGPPNSEASFLIRCETAQRRIVFSREGRLRGSDGVMSFTTTSQTRSYPAQYREGALSYITAATGAQDGWLDELAFTRGRFSVAVSDQPLLVLPNWPQMIRVIEDCRG